MTSMEREEKEKVKKREKKLEDEETMQQATWVKYTFPIKHQVGGVSDVIPDFYQSELCSGGSSGCRRCSLLTDSRFVLFPEQCNWIVQLRYNTLKCPEK